MIEKPQQNELAIDCFLLAGRIMMESGAETYRVEDTMLRMARSQNMNDAQSYVTPTGIIFSLGKHSQRVFQLFRQELRTYIVLHLLIMCRESLHLTS